MITKLEEETIQQLAEEDYYAAILLLALCRYHRLNKEARELDLDLGPKDFVEIVDEAFADYEEFTKEPNVEET